MGKQSGGSFFFRAGQTFLWNINSNRDSNAKMIFVGKNMYTFANLMATKSSIKSVFDIRDHYDKTDDGTVVVNATICNLAAMKQVKELLDEEEQKVVIIHFFFQMPYLQEYFGDADNVEYCLFSYTDMFGE